jgi:hypothetical protein
MFNTISPTWLLGGWLVAVVAIVAWSVTLDARLSTSAFLFGIGLAPAVVLLFMRAGAASPTVAEILHSTPARDDR